MTRRLRGGAWVIAWVALGCGFPAENAPRQTHAAEPQFGRLRQALSANPLLQATADASTPASADSGPRLSLDVPSTACSGAQTDAGAGSCSASTPICGDNRIQATEQCDGLALPANAPAGSRCDERCRLVRPAATPRCGEEQDPRTAPCESASPPAGAPTGSAEPVGPPPRCGDGIINQASEQCDRSSLPPLTSAAVTCSSACQLELAAARCGDGIINQSFEQCDGDAFPETLPEGGVCTPDCLLLDPLRTCRSCVTENCSEARAEVDAKPEETGRILDCMLGPAWSQTTRVPADRCGNANLSECYCGPISISYCVTAPPDTLNGDCTSPMLMGMGCTTSDCVATRLASSDNASGRAMQYASCLHDYCYDECLTAPGAVCGDGVVSGREQCDGVAVPPGRSCSAACTLLPQAVRCGDGSLNQPSEQCDGDALPVPAPAGLRCSASCLLEPVP